MTERLRPVVLLAALGLACRPAPVQSMLDPAGPAAARLVDLWWFLLAATGIPTVITLAVIGWALRRRRRGTIGEPARLDLWIIALAGGVIPAGLLLTMLVFSFRVGADTAAPPGEPALDIEVVGHQFWWEVRYPEQDVITANEIHIPVGEPVRIQLRSADVIHSFWVPKLHGKTDLVPGHVNTMWLQADRAGVFRGQCAEFCGVQHALMAFLVVAEPRADFDAWLVRQARPAEEPTDALRRRGREVYFALGCAACHHIKGVTPPLASQATGPDLTHLASRRTLAAATVENNRGNLGGWLVNPQAIKPGNRMPPSMMASADLHALIAFLEALE